MVGVYGLKVDRVGEYGMGGSCPIDIWLFLGLLGGWLSYLNE